jgi:hypothetical protein
MNIMKYILIDFENVQPTSLEILKNQNCKVIIFIGKNQNKIPIKLTVSMQELGDNGRYVITNHTGKNSLDFHIAYYIGKLITENVKNEVSFCLISKDKGYDGLISFLKSNKVAISRFLSVNDVFDSTIFRTTKNKVVPNYSNNLLVEKVIDYFKNSIRSKPNKEIGLMNLIRSSILKNTTTDIECKKILTQMKTEKLIDIDRNGNIKYLFLM